jgi:hypothetical protein
VKTYQPPGGTSPFTSLAAFTGALVQLSGLPAFEQWADHRHIDGDLKVEIRNSRCFAIRIARLTIDFI